MPRFVLYHRVGDQSQLDPVPTAVVGPPDPAPADPPALGALLAAVWATQMLAAELATALGGHRCRRDRAGVCRLCEAARQAEAADTLLDYLEKGLAPQVLAGDADAVALARVADAAFFRLQRAVRAKAGRKEA